MHERLMDYYKAIEASSRQMLEAARAEEWDEVVRCEGACAVLIERLRFLSKSQELPKGQRAEKSLIMQRILRNDAEIRVLAEPWLSTFAEMFDTRLQLIH
ncbi:flagellar protein FliT [Variovorax sp. J22P168]|uniref:flagellar protein FliT n=1 Tax=Variovorax jilinensis TaxID=3053513 RepID=UPI002577A35F|nr:flagellar protein FliT [Variovorax sp. J22P168]MDM0014765.1 flagellar protein FliT [Variovorax sp. J22P168]